MSSFQNMDKEDLLELNDTCEMACSYHLHGEAFTDREILLEKVSVEDVLNYWATSKILWENGFSEDLSIDALELLTDWKATEDFAKFLTEGHG